MSQKSTLLISLLLAGHVAQAQVQNMRYVDFHIHTSMKNYYRDIENPDKLLPAKQDTFDTFTNSNWSGTKHRSHFKSGPKRPFSGFYGKNSRPEASWDLLANMNPRPWVLCTSITPIEKRFVSERRVPVLFIKPKIRTINDWLVTRLPPSRQNTIYHQPSINELMAELEYMKRQGTNPRTGRQDVRLVKDKADLQRAINNNAVALLLTIEGAHAFMGKSTVHKEFEPTFGINSNNIQEIFDNIDSVKAMPTHVFFTTLSHMSWNAMCGHAKSLDMNKQLLRLILGYQSEDKRFRSVTTSRFANNIGGNAEVYDRADDAFATTPCSCQDPLVASYPTYGMQVMKRLLDKRDNRHRILIDTRHLAVQGRKQYIDSVIAWRQQGDTIPVIISHAAANGKTYNQAAFFGTCPFQDRYLEVRKTKRFYDIYNRCLPDSDKVDVRKTGWFHPFSINLYDEEIAAVAQTRGIIGVTLEERVLGTKRYNYDRKHYRQLKRAYKRWPNPHAYSYMQLKKLEPFMRNVLYIASVLDSANRAIYNEPVGNGWNYLAIGSDFDGMIDPLDICAEPADLPKFYEMLEQYLPVYAGEIYGAPYLVDRGNVRDRLNKLFYLNGEEFIMTHFK